MSKLLRTTATALGILMTVVFAQDKKHYVKGVLSFDYLPGWNIIEKPGKDSYEVALSNAEADARVSVIVLHQSISSKEPMADARKRVIDPWLDALIRQYTYIGGFKVERNDVKTEAGGVPTDGVKLNFTLDGQKGSVEACWVLLGKKLLLLYTVRPDGKLSLAGPGWDKIRSTVRIEPNEKSDKKEKGGSGT